MAAKNDKKKTTKKKAASRPIFIINRSNVLGWILAGFLGCLLMFVLGVLVGRNQAPIHFDIKRLDEKLTNLKQSVLTTKIKPFDVIGNLKQDGVPEVRENDPHTLSPKYTKKDITEDSVSPETLNPEPTGAQPESNASETETETPAPAETQSTASKAEISAPVQDTAPDPMPVKKPAAPASRRSAATDTASPKYAGVDGYAIQIASLSDPESAALVRDRFLEKGYPAYCRKADVNGKTWHRVRIGPYPSKEKAQKDLKSLNDAGVSAMIFLAEGSNP